MKYRIRINTVIVAESNTSMHQNGIKTFENPEEKLKSFTGKIISEKQPTTPEDIATIIVFLYQKDQATPRAKSFMSMADMCIRKEPYNL